MKLACNGIHIEVEDSGGDGEPVLLVMGLGGQLIHWPDSLIQALLEEGYRVIRLDNRDSGFSTHFHAAGTPNLAWIAAQVWIGFGMRLPYTLADMADDVVAVLEALRIPEAHVLGLSMGAMIAQRVALSAPGRIRSLTCIMGSSGARGTMTPRASVMRTVAGKPRGAAGDPEVLARYYTRFLRTISSQRYGPSEEAIREVLESTARRHLPDSVANYRQLAAVIADTGRADMLRRISCPTLVIHGAEDPLVPRAGSVDTARRIPNAQLEIIPDMAHDLVPVPHPEIVRRVLAVQIPFLRKHPFE